LATIAGEPHSSAERNPPAPADEDHGMTSRRRVPSRSSEGRLWLQEPGRPTTWHIANELVSYGWYRMACGWELQVSDAESVWPTKGDEPEPLRSARCRSCTQMHEVNRQINAGFGSGRLGQLQR
jgi:hypothetical protein